MKKIRKLLGNQKGFTVLELIVVVIILGILAIVFFPSIKGREDSAKNQATETQIYRIIEATRLWRINNGLPDYSTFVWRNENDNSVVNAGLLQAKDFKSAYGNTITVSASGNSFTMTTQIAGNKPDVNCQSLRTRLSQRGLTASCGGTGNSTLTVTFTE